MIDTRTEKAIRIHAANYGPTCRSTCPLAAACLPQIGDTPTIFYARINKAAEEVTA